MSVSEESLIAIFEHYVRTYHKELLRFAVAAFRKNGGSADIDRAEEAVQETFTIAWQKRDAFLTSESPVGWLYITLKNVSRNMLRQNQQWALHILQAQQAMDKKVVPPPGKDLELEGIVSEEDFALLKQLYLYGETYEELAQRLGIKKSTLAMRVHRIKENFRKNYREIENISASEDEQSDAEKHANSRGGLIQ